MIIVFARAPVPGKVKTRLAARIGEWRAARLHLRLTEQALRVARAAGIGRVELHGTSGHKLFPKRIFRLQRGNDLGARMLNALRRARRPALLIGSDCPVLTAADLRRADRWLRGGCDAVLAPAEDGGYALIGLSRLAPGLFDNVAWGTSRALQDTLKNLDRARYRVRLLRTVWDVDRPEDLDRLAGLRSRRFS